MEPNLPTYTARLTFVVGRDENRLLVLDEQDERAAETTWRPSGVEQPGPGQWDFRLLMLGYRRSGPWQPYEGLGFRAVCERVSRPQ